MGKFGKGDRVMHPLFGCGTLVEIVDEDRVEVAFDDGTTRVVSLRQQFLRKLLREEGETPAVRTRVPLDRVFEQEAEDDHSPGSHWSPFFDDLVGPIMSRLPAILADARLARGLGDIPGYDPPLLHTDWPKGFLLRWPYVANDVRFVLKVEPAANVLASMFPRIGAGTREVVKLVAVHVWSNRLEAQVTVSLGCAMLCFFDTEFLANAGWYRAGASLEFAISGLAYSCSYANEPDIELADDDVLVRDYRAAVAMLGGDAADPPRRISLKGMAVLIPAAGAGADRDDHDYRGTILEIRDSEMLGQPAWLLTVCVLRALDDDDREFHLKILVTRRVWKEEGPPQIGDDVSGTLWLQGRLWSSPEVPAVESPASL